MRANVRLTKGFFENTLPGFVAQHPGAKLALLHIDCDLYSATRTILGTFRRCSCPARSSSLTSCINYHGWEEGEFKAFVEFAAERGLAFEYIAYNRTGSQVAVRILRGAPIMFREGGGFGLAPPFRGLIYAMHGRRRNS